MSLQRNLIGLAAALVICFAAAGVGGLFTAQSVKTWYPQLAIPSFTPPSWVFAPVWNALYLMMAISVWLVWRKAGFSRGGLALGLFIAQLLANVGWSILFFGLRSPGAALIEIGVLWVLILLTVILFWRITPWAGGLLVPYLLWVSFAVCLNAGIWRLNG